MNCHTFYSLIIVNIHQIVGVLIGLEYNLKYKHTKKEMINIINDVQKRKSNSADPSRHIKKKQLGDISHKICIVKLRMHSRNAKRAIPQLNVKPNSLLKQIDHMKQHNHILLPNLKICSFNYRIHKSYHICEHNPHSICILEDRT